MLFRSALGAVAAVGAAGLVTIAAPAANAAPFAGDAITASIVGRAGVGIFITANVTDSALGSGDARVCALATSYPTLATVSASAAQVNSSLAVTAGSTSNTTPVSWKSLSGHTADTLTAGTYQFLLWASDTTVACSDSGPSGVQPYTNVTMTMGGVPASITLSSTSASIPKGESTTAVTSQRKTVTATLKDAAGNVTLLIAPETISVAPNAATAWVRGYTDTTTATNGNALGSIKFTSFTDNSNGTYSVQIGNSAAGTSTFTFAGANTLLAAGITAQTYTLTTLSVATNVPVALPATLTGVSGYLDATLNNTGSVSRPYYVGVPADRLNTARTGYTTGSFGSTASLALSTATGKTFTVTSVSDTTNAYLNALCTKIGRAHV